MGRLERNEFRFAPPLNRTPLIPAEAGIQFLIKIRPKSWARYERRYSRSLRRIEPMMLE
jgi:hypothetical protein